MLDWNSQSTRDKMRYESKYFPDVESGGKVGIQIASSGPDEEWEQIKYGYLKMISEAKNIFTYKHLISFQIYHF